MKLSDSKCPNCGSIVQLQAGKEIQYCQYCGNQIIVEDENSKTTNFNHKYIDEAKIKQIEAEKEIRLKKEEEQKQERVEYQNTNRTLLIVWVISMIAFLILGAVDKGFWAVLLIDLILGAIIATSRSKK